MGKSMYSLILADDVVSAVDKLAYAQSTSRSNLINRILAEHLSVLTPEKRIAQILSTAAATTQGHQTLQAQPFKDRTILEVKSVLTFKYNPTIRYRVEIFTGADGYRGEFRMLSRTQSDTLLSRLTVFFEIWSQIEHFCLLNHASMGAPKHKIGTGRYCRQLKVQDAGEIYDSQALGQAIGVYIRLFDTALSLYFNAPNGVDMETYDGILTMYKSYLKNCELVL